MQPIIDFKSKFLQHPIAATEFLGIRFFSDRFVLSFYTQASDKTRHFQEVKFALCEKLRRSVSRISFLVQTRCGWKESAKRNLTLVFQEAHQEMPEELEVVLENAPSLHSYSTPKSPLPTDYFFNTSSGRRIFFHTSFLSCTLMGKAMMRSGMSLQPKEGKNELPFCIADKEARLFLSVFYRTLEGFALLNEELTESNFPLFLKLYQFADYIMDPALTLLLEEKLQKRTVSEYAYFRLPDVVADFKINFPDGFVVINRYALSLLGGKFVHLVSASNSFIQITDPTLSLRVMQWVALVTSLGFSPLKTIPPTLMQELAEKLESIPDNELLQATEWLFHSNLLSTQREILNHRWLKAFFRNEIIPPLYPSLTPTQLVIERGFSFFHLQESFQGAWQQVEELTIRNVDMECLSVLFNLLATKTLRVLRFERMPSLNDKQLFDLLKNVSTDRLELSDCPKIKGGGLVGKTELRTLVLDNLPALHIPFLSFPKLETLILDLHPNCFYKLPNPSHLPCLVQIEVRNQPSFEELMRLSIYPVRAIVLPPQYECESLLKQLAVFTFLQQVILSTCGTAIRIYEIQKNEAMC